MFTEDQQRWLSIALDGLFTRYVLGRRRDSPMNRKIRQLPAALHIRRLRAMAERHERWPYNASPETFFKNAGTPGPMEVMPVRQLSSHGHVFDLRWPSRYELLAEDPELAHAYHSHTANHHAYARCYFHEDGPRPTLILIHGYMGGHLRSEESIWPIEWFFESLNLDVALFVLPFHGMRGVHGEPPLCPGLDLPLNVDGFRQAMHDLLHLRSYLRSRGASSIGLMGVSLGGYSTALALTIDPGFDFGIPLMPFASFADMARENLNLFGTKYEEKELHRLLERIYSPVSPLSRPVQLPPNRLCIGVGKADRVTPESHALRLAKHFNAPVQYFRGGHLLSFGRARVYDALRALLDDAGLLNAAP